MSNRVTVTNPNPGHGVSDLSQEVDDIDRMLDEMDDDDDERSVEGADGPLQSRQMAEIHG